ncbi:MAG: COQ9 family protein [Blastomonas sp.]|uniref:COQ9 family protein n=1 Tax=Blastomonas TaxID=150203 RepID=UPI00083CD412|nr:MULTISPECIES: COQ9 family protein [Blastomonas]AOF99638.1 COQ9 family protein [Blastomonas sp. RAC04]MCO5791856.1 COQ9 family protein [Blastomonas sp.]MDK2759125.1 COQ9 family protein [Blastomonas fulva]
MYRPTKLDTLPADATLDEVRLFLPPFIADEAVFDGWTPAARDAAASAQGVEPGLAQLAFDQGAMDMIEAWISHIDAQMIEAFPPERIAAMKIRERITALVAFRFEAVAHQREALRRATAILALPSNLGRAAKLSWRTADLMWRLAGDTATDYNHYSKRMILSGVYGSTLMAFLDDESADFADTHAFLGRRIDNVMQFEKAKAKWTKGGESLSLTRFLGRLRYPAR